MRKNGVTLIEICVVTAILAGLIATAAIITSKMNARKAAASESTALTLAKTNVKGGHSWVPVTRDGNVGQNHEFLLQIMADFEREHPEFELYDVDVQTRQVPRGIGSVLTTEIDGVWFHYHVKAESAEFGGK